MEIQPDGLGGVTTFEVKITRWEEGQHGDVELTTRFEAEVCAGCEDEFKKALTVAGIKGLDAEKTE